MIERDDNLGRISIASPETAGDGIETYIAGWRFAGDSVKNFDEHIGRSVPLYSEGHQLICDASDFFVKRNSVVYDIGCSTGTLILKLATKKKICPAPVFFGVDIEADMIHAAKEKQSLKYPCAGVEFINEDVVSLEMAASDMIICYYSIQFIDPAFRQEVINKFYRSLNRGGGLFLFEKVRASDARFQDMMTTLYTDYKLRVGYSPEEIIGKARSLKGILEPFSTASNFEMLQKAGFSDALTIQKYICFEGLLAIK